MATADWTQWDTFAGALRTELLILNSNLYAFASDAKLYLIDEDNIGGAAVVATCSVIGDSLIGVNCVLFSNAIYMSCLRVATLKPVVFKYDGSLSTVFDAHTDTGYNVYYYGRIEGNSVGLCQPMVGGANPGDQFGLIWYSTNGTSWFEGENDGFDAASSNTAPNICAHDNRFVAQRSAGGAGNWVKTATADLSSWSNYGAAAVVGIKRDRDTNYLYGPKSGNADLWQRTADGWLNVADYLTDTGLTDNTAILWHRRRFWTGGDAGVVYYDPDGGTWVQDYPTVPTANRNAVSLITGDTGYLFAAMNFSGPSYELYKRHALLPFPEDFEFQPVLAGAGSGEPVYAPVSMSISPDDYYIYVACMLGGNPVLLQLLADLTADPINVYDPGAGSAIGVQCADLHDTWVWIAGDFGGAVKVRVSLDDGATWTTKDPGGWSGVALPLVVGPDDDHLVLVPTDGDDDLFETIDGGLNWATLNDTLPFDVNGMDRLDINLDEIMLGSDAGRDIRYTPNNGVTLHDLTDASMANVRVSDLIIG